MLNIDFSLFVISLIEYSCECMTSFTTNDSNYSNRLKIDRLFEYACGFMTSCTTNDSYRVVQTFVHVVAPSCKCVIIETCVFTCVTLIYIYIYDIILSYKYIFYSNKVYIF